LVTPFQCGAYLQQTSCRNSPSKCKNFSRNLWEYGCLISENHRDSLMSTCSFLPLLTLALAPALQDSLPGEVENLQVENSHLTCLRWRVDQWVLNETLMPLPKQRHDWIRGTHSMRKEWEVLVGKESSKLPLQFQWMPSSTSPGASCLRALAVLD
jgi:hypothetical protein